MEEKHYPFERPISEIRYNFTSISNEKVVNKRVIFTTSNYQDIYNLALVDVLDDGSISDITETRNKDMRIVLATVIKIVEEFLSKHPRTVLIFQGSDERRQRLYRLIIGKELPKIEQKFVVLGGYNGLQPQPFEPNKEFSYFIISKIR